MKTQKFSMKNAAAVIIIAAVVGLGAFWYYTQLPASVKQADQQTQKGTVVGNKVVEAEIARLASLAASGKMAESDMDAVKLLVKDDESAADEVEEISTLVSYGEFVHAGHGLGFLAGYVSTGMETICPGHALSHYYVFSRHNETELAEENLQSAKDQVEEWEPKAREFAAKYPGEKSFDEIDAIVKGAIESIDAGNSTASDEEIDFLAEKTICVQ